MKLHSIKSQKNFSQQSSVGFSIVEVLVAVSLLGVLSLGFFRYMSNSLESQKHLEIRGDLENLKRNLHQNLSCEASLPPGPCPDDTWVTLKKRGGGVIVNSNSSTGSKIGEWNVRAFCKDYVLKVQYAKLSSEGTAVNDPMMKGKTLGWTDLFPAGLEKCIAEGRTAYMSMPPGSYNYVSVSNVGTTNQSVTVAFNSTGFTMAPGGFLSDINGWASPGGAVGSSGVSCGTTSYCSATQVLAPGRSMRVGTRVTCPTCAPYQGLTALTHSGTNVGLLASVFVAESSGNVVASALSWFDYDISPSYFYDTSAAGVFNGGVPF